jgi:hypothetical protein
MAMLFLADVGMEIRPVDTKAEIPEHGLPENEVTSGENPGIFSFFGMLIRGWYKSVLSIFYKREEAAIVSSAEPNESDDRG